MKDRKDRFDALKQLQMNLDDLTFAKTNLDSYAYLSRLSRCVPSSDKMLDLSAALLGRARFGPFRTPR